MNKLLSTTDVWFASFLIHKGYQVKTFDKLGPGKVKFYFDLTEDEWKQMKLDFNNSELVKFKSIIGQLKDLSF